jgi:hypothetical protein
MRKWRLRHPSQSPDIQPTNTSIRSDLCHLCLLPSYRCLDTWGTPRYQLHCPHVAAVICWLRPPSGSRAGCTHCCLHTRVTPFETCSTAIMQLLPADCPPVTEACCLCLLLHAKRCVTHLSTSFAAIMQLLLATWCCYLLAVGSPNAACSCCCMLSGLSHTSWHQLDCHHAAAVSFLPAVCPPSVLLHVLTTARNTTCRAPWHQLHCHHAVALLICTHPHIAFCALQHTEPAATQQHSRR